MSVIDLEETSTGTGGNQGGPVQVFGTILTVGCGHGQMS